mmetsp:Transcript_9743/g.22986  ORF Transcript_9743/g.22986 Transcript_9743/m.22986 type:complete len:303 (+) Transcript_9743:650-1558(+)
MARPSISSARARGIPSCTAAHTVSVAPLRSGKGQIAASTSSGWPCSRRATSVITPSVPSDPMKRLVMSYPALLFRARVPVSSTEPSAITTVNPITLSRIVPYRTALVPDAAVAVIPPRVASAPGSTVKVSPVCRSSSLSCSRVTPAWTLQSRSSSLTSTIWFIPVRSRLTPPSIAFTWPSRLVPAPNGTTGRPCSAQILTAVTTSSVELQKTTASGAIDEWKDSSRPWASRMLGFVDTTALFERSPPARSSSAALSAATHASVTSGEARAARVANARVDRAAATPILDAIIIHVRGSAWRTS